MTITKSISSNEAFFVSISIVRATSSIDFYLCKY